MYRSLIFCFLYSVFHFGYGQPPVGSLPVGSIIPAMQAGSEVMKLLPPQTRDCVNKVTTKAVSDSLVSKIASMAGGLGGNAAPQITRDPGMLECKNNVQYYKETAHLKANVFSLPIDLPVTTESDLTPCLSGIVNFCTILGPNGGTLINGLTGANKPNPQLTVGGTAIGGNTNTNTNGQSGGGLGSLLGGSSNNGASTSNSGASGSNGSNGNGFGKLFGGGNSNTGAASTSNGNGNPNPNPLGSLFKGGNNGNAPNGNGNGNGNGNADLFESRGHN